MNSFLDKEIVKLVPPTSIKREQLIGLNFGIRPHRKGGLRLDREDIKGKAIFHNYGHGGAGVSLAYGSARKIVDKFIMEIGSKVKTVAILGSGYMGIFQALMLSNLGFTCNIYATAFPKKFGVYSKDSPVITSQVAAGLWLPLSYDITNQALHDSISHESYHYYK